MIAEDHQLCHLMFVTYDYLSGNTPLHLSCENQSDNDDKIKEAESYKDDKIKKVYLLLSYGADFLVENNMRMRPFQLMQVKYMSDKVGESFDGVVSGISERGLFVILSVISC